MAESSGCAVLNSRLWRYTAPACQKQPKIVEALDLALGHLQLTSFLTTMSYFTGATNIVVKDSPFVNVQVLKGAGGWSNLSNSAY